MSGLKFTMSDVTLFLPNNLSCPSLKKNYIHNCVDVKQQNCAIQPVGHTEHE